MKIAALIQARLGSTRLPCKVLKDIGGRTMLARVVRRAQRAAGIDEVVVVTTTQPADSAVAEESARLGVSCFAETNWMFSIATTRLQSSSRRMRWSALLPIVR